MDTPIDIQISKIDNKPDTNIIRFVGDLDATNVEMTLKQIMDLFESGTINIIADFKMLRYVNSTGLGILIHISRTAKEKNGCFKIANINENVYEIIEIIGATSLLEIYDSIDSAINSL